MLLSDINPKTKIGTHLAFSCILYTAHNSQDTKAIMAPTEQNQWINKM